MEQSEAINNISVLANTISSDNLLHTFVITKYKKAVGIKAKFKFKNEEEAKLLADSLNCLLQNLIKLQS